MYEGSNPSALRSQIELADALFKLMKQYEFGKITITMICQEAQISRQTFYQLFDGRDDVVRYYIIKDYDEFEIGVRKNRHFTLAEFVEYTICFFCKKKDFFDIMIAKHLQSIFLDTVQEKLRRILQIFENSELTLGEPTYTFFTAGLCALFLYEIEHRDNEEFHSGIMEFANFLGNPDLYVKKEKEL